MLWDCWTPRPASGGCCASRSRRSSATTRAATRTSRSRSCGRVGTHSALPAQAVPQRLPAGDAAALQLPDRAAGDARPDAAEALPAPARRADAVPVAAGLDARRQPLGPGEVHLHLRHPGRLALAGLLRNLARHGRMAAAGSEVARCGEVQSVRCGPLQITEQMARYGIATAG